MTTPRKHLLPKRWLRSIAGAALATGLAGGALWAQDPPIPAPKPMDAKLEAPKDKAPAPAAKQKLLTFSMSVKPWNDVMTWYANETGMAFNSVERPPDGTFNFTPPKDAKTGQPKLYTLSEVTDIINESLLAKNMVLVRQETTFRLWPADKTIDPTLVRRVDLDELRTLSTRDMVQVVLPLKALVAADQVANVRKMMSTVGEVVAFEGGRNALLMTDMAGNLRRIVEDLKATETEDGAAAETFSYPCKYIKARDGAAQVREFLLGPQEQPTDGRDRRMGGGGFDRFGGFGGGGFSSGGGGFDPRSFDPRSGFDPRSMMDPRSGGGDPRRGGLPGARPGKQTIVTHDDATNTVHINAPADHVSRAKSYLTKIDVGREPIIPGKAEWQTYTVPAGTADAFAQALQEQHRTTTVRIRALTANQIVVYATPADQLDVIEYIRSNEKANKEVAETIAVTSMDVGEAVLILKGMFAEQTKGGPYIAAHPNGNGVVVRGKPEQVAAVKEVLNKGIGDGSDTTTPGSGNVRIINLKEGSAAELAEAIRGLMEGMGKNPVKVIRPDGGPVYQPPAPKPLIPPRPLPDKPGDGPDGKKGLLPPGGPKAYGLGVRDLDTSRMLAMGEQLVDPSEVKPKKSEGSPVTITAVGDRLIITGDDPKAVALAHELARLIVGQKGELFKVFRLENANAVEAARVINEWFNPQATQQQGQQQRNQNPFAAFMPGGGFGRGGFGADPAAAQAAADAMKPRVKVVAEQSSNSLLVRANALDMLTIQNMLKTVIDAGPGDSKAVIKPFFIGPLQYAVATEVVTILKEVYRESTSEGVNRGGGGGGFGGGFTFGGFGGIGGGGRGGSQQLDALGRPRQVTLTLAADDRTNSIVGSASELMAKDIEKVVQMLEDKAKDSTKVVQLVPTRGIDPYVVQEVIDAIQGRTPATRAMQPGGTSPFGTTSGISPFGGMGGTGSGRFGGGTSGFGTPTGGRFGTGGRGGMGGTRGGGFGGRGGGSRAPRAPEPPPGGDVGRGPDFFEQRDMDVPQQTLLYDPYEEAMSLRRAGGPGHEVHTLDPIRLASGTDGPRLPDNLLVQAQPIVPKAPPKGAGVDLIGPRGPVTAEPLDEFGAVIITANNQADLQLALQIIKQLEEYLRSEAATAGPRLMSIDLQHADAVELTNLVNQLGARASGGAAATQARPATQTPAFGGGFPFFGGFGQQQQQQQAAGGGSVLLIPNPRRNSILLFGSDLRLPYYLNLIKQLDVPNTNRQVPFPLQKAAAQQVATYLTQFYAQRYPGVTATGNLIRFTYDTSSNTVFVQAGPADLDEIRAIIERLDTSTPAAVNELRIIRLRNSPAEELAATLQSALLQNILPQGTGVVQAAAQPGGAAGAFGAFGAFGGLGQQQQQQPLGGGQFGQALGGARAATLGSQASNTTKTVTLRFLAPGKDGTFESGYLEDVHITPDIRSNSLLVSAPRQTQELLAAVIAALDVPSAARANVNIFTLKRADATLTANLLQQLFGGGARQQQGQQPGGGFPGGGGPFGQQQPLGGANQQGFRPLLTTTGLPGEGAGLIPLQIGVDDPSNSIIVAASQNDLDAIRAIIARLEDAPIQRRATHVIKLRNAGAADVAAALEPFLTRSLQVIQTGLTQTNYLEVQRNIVVAPEPVTNNLLISATPEALASLIPVIERLDATPLQVSVEVLIAEVALTNNEEFGIEVGLQSPVLFSRSVIPATSTTLSNATGGIIPPGVTVNSTITQFAGTAFPFNNVTSPTTFYNSVNPSLVGFQGLTNYGTGRANANGIGGFVFSAGSDTVNVLIRALKTQGRVDNLTRPTITVLDNQIGSVNVGGLYPYVTGGQFTALGTFQPQIAQQQIGTTLTVTPRISPEGRILMRVEPSIVAPQETLINLGNGQFATAFSQQAVQTTVSVADGETIVLGGLITKTNIRQENKVPWLGDLPYCGALFRFRTQSQERRELLVILTPHIIRNCADSERFLIEEARKMSWTLKDVDALFSTAGTVGPGPGVLVGPEGVAAPLPAPAPAQGPKDPPIPPAKNGGDPLPMPVKPPVPELPKIEVPTPPKSMAPATGGPVLPTAGYEPARGIVMPGEARGR